jgi:hypothetical protein
MDGKNVQTRIIFLSTDMIHDKDLIYAIREWHESRHNSSFWPGHCLHFSSSKWYPRSQSHCCDPLHIENSKQSESFSQPVASANTKEIHYHSLNIKHVLQQKSEPSELIPNVLLYSLECIKISTTNFHYHNRKDKMNKLIYHKNEYTFLYNMKEYIF